MSAAEVKSVRTLRRRAAELCTFEYRMADGRWHPCIDTAMAAILLKGGYDIRACLPTNNEGDAP